MAELTKIVEVAGRGVPVPGDNINTDIIIPARFLKFVTFEPLGEYAFEDERYDHDNEEGRTEEKDHPFNQEQYQGASILFVRKNFGCGSSREHAPQALMRWGRRDGHTGIRAVIGESFAEIFEANCRALGIVAATLNAHDMGYVMDLLRDDPGADYIIDVRDKTLMFFKEGLDHAGTYDLQIPDATRTALLEGTWNSTNMLLADEAAIDRKRKELPYMEWFSTQI